MSVDDANERLIAALCELHNAEIEFIVSRLADLAERNPDMTPEEGAKRRPQIEEELQEFEDSVRGIIEEEVARRREEPRPECSQYPEGSIERMVCELLDELDQEAEE